MTEPARPDPGTAGGRLRTALALGGPPLLVLALVIGAWYFVTYRVLAPRRRFLLPAPHRVFEVGFLDGRNRGELFEALGNTTRVALVGLAVAIVIGMGWAVAMSQARWVERSLYPYAVVLQTVPILALVPLIGFWLGFSFVARVVVCLLVALFPIINNTLFGLLSTDANQHDLFTLHGAGRMTRLRKLQLPAAMPAVFAGFRISAGLSVIVAIVGDFFFRRGTPGIGARLSLYASRLQSEQLFAAIILSSLLGIVVFWLFGLIGNRVVGSWYGSGRSDR